MPASVSGFPAHAGMDPHPTTPAGVESGLPRTRGDGPRPACGAPAAVWASPHTRGWTPGGGCWIWTSSGFPAHAGMDPRPARSSSTSWRLPRTRGDGPRRPRERAAPVAASPHTRGWTLRHREPRGSHPGFPAHAGMAPRTGRAACCARRLPRTRGDGPGIPLAASPYWVASPHTRGWTPSNGVAISERDGFPAHAGMDRRDRRRDRLHRRLPRTRGDGPDMLGDPNGAGRASPHTRGWTRDRAVRPAPAAGFPAHAGMDPVTATDEDGNERLPRTRGYRCY